MEEEPSTTEASKSKQKSAEIEDNALARGQIMYPEHEITYLRTRSAVTWRLRPHNIVLVPAAGELASYHRCHVRASRGPPGGDGRGAARAAEMKHTTRVCFRRELKSRRGGTQNCAAEATHS